MQKGKYNQEWLARNNITEDWFEENRLSILGSISKCQSSVLKFVITDKLALEACLPACFGFNFHVSKPDHLGYIEITVYIK